MEELGFFSTWYYAFAHQKIQTTLCYGGVYPRETMMNNFGIASNNRKECEIH